MDSMSTAIHRVASRRGCAGVAFFWLSIAPMESAIADPPGRRVYSISPDDQTLREIDPGTGGTRSSVSLSFLQPAKIGGVHGMAVHPLTADVYVTLRVGDLSLLATLDLETGRATYIGDLGDEFATLAFTPGSLVGVTTSTADHPSELFQIDPDTAQTTSLLALTQATGFGDKLEAIAYNPTDGLLYRAAGSGSAKIFESIDLQTLTATPIPITGQVYYAAQALVHAGGGTLYMADFDGALFSVTLAGSASVQLIGQLGNVNAGGLILVGSAAPVLYVVQDHAPWLLAYDMATVQKISQVAVHVIAPPVITRGHGLAAHPFTGDLWGVLTVSDQRMVGTISTSTGEVSLVGAIPEGINCLAFSAAGALYGVTNGTSASDGSLYEIDPSNGHATHLGPLAGNGDAGDELALNPSDGWLYRVRGQGVPNASQFIERLDPLTLQTTIVQQSGADHDLPLALTATSSGDLLLADDEEKLFRITTSGLITEVAKLDHVARGLAELGPGSLVSVGYGNLLRAIHPDTGVTLASIELHVKLPQVATVTGLAARPGSLPELYALLDLVGQTGTELARVNPTTGSLIRVGDLGDRYTGITFDASGRLYGVTGESSASPESLFEIDPGDATTALLAQLGNGSLGETVAFDPIDDRLYHASGQGTPNDIVNGEVLEWIDPASQSVNNVPLWGDDYDQATAAVHLLGEVLLVADSAGRLYTVGTNGMVKQRGTLDHRSAGLAVVDLFHDLLVLQKSGSGGVALFRLDPFSLLPFESTDIVGPGISASYGRALVRHPISGDIYALLGYQTLARVNAKTGDAIVVGGVGDSFEALAFDAAGTLFGVTDGSANVDHMLYQIDPNTAQPTPLLQLDTWVEGDSIAYHPADGLLYRAATPMLTTIDPSIPQVTSNVLLSGAQPNSPNEMISVGPDRFLMSCSGYFELTSDGTVRPLRFDAPVVAAGLALVPGDAFEPIGTQCFGSGGFAAELTGCGEPQPGETVSVGITHALGGAAGLLLIGTHQATIPINSGCALDIAPASPSHLLPLSLGGAGAGGGSWTVQAILPPSVASGEIYLQAVILDPGGTGGIATTNALRMRIDG